MGEHPTVETSYGTLRGSAEDGVCVFRGVPFAAAPVGELRWRAPQEPEPWGGVREATAFGPAAPQGKRPVGEIIGVRVDETDEDCLTLNVWTPGLDDARRPVMVWIHGGAFVIGAGSQGLYDGRHLARRGDVVVVTINYRLGVFGFLRAPELGATGNEGLLDQVAALRWVKQEIARFGGDPENVTVFGESAGAISIGYLFGAPAADGLFAKAILSSGGAALGMPSAAADTVADEVLAELGLDRGSAEQARERTTADVFEAAQRVTAARATAGLGAAPFAPVLDGEVIAADPLDRLRAGEHRDVAVMTGSNRDEMAIYMAFDPSFPALHEEGLLRRIEGVFPGRAREAVAAYRSAQEARGEAAEPGDLLIAMMTDSVFRIPDVRIAEAQSGQQANTFMYLFDWESPMQGGAFRSCHALDLGFAWGTLGWGTMPEFCGSGKAADRLSATMMDAWLAFARSGAPSTPDLPWPRYEAGRRATMRLGAECRVEEGPMEAERAFWAATG